MRGIAGFAQTLGNIFGAPRTNSFGSFLSNLLPYGNLIDNGIGLVSGIANNIYDRQLQDTLFARDDTQLDRIMAQYQRNGLNPLLALPNATAGNTRGPEPANIQSDFNQSILNSYQRKTMHLTEQKMYLENSIAREDLEDRKLTNAMNRQLLQGDINANYTNFVDYYKNQTGTNKKYNKMPYPNGGVRSIPGSEKERLVRWLLNEVLGIPTGDSSESSGSTGSSNRSKQVTQRDYLNQQAQEYVESGKFTRAKGLSNYNYRYQVGDTTFKVYIKPDGMIEVVTPRVNGEYNSQEFVSFESAINYCQDFVRSY